MSTGIQQDDDLGGVVVATALPYSPEATAPAGLAIDYDTYADHCRWLVDNGCDAVGPNGSLGEYSALTDGERRAVARTAIEAVADRGKVIVGVHGPGAHQAAHWAELSAADGADGVLCLPPTMYRANPGEVVRHYEAVAAVGLPVMAYNNPLDTKVDLTPDLLAEIAQIDNVVAVMNAWTTGAADWDKDLRVEIANDPLNLVASDGPANMGKGARDASEWLPENQAYRCEYVARQIAVKEKYDLWITPAEHDAMEDVLTSCPSEPLPTR